MLLENLRYYKEVSKKTYEQIAEESKTAISTVKHIFAGDSEPLASTLHRIAKALNVSLDDILADTNVVLSPKRLIEVEEKAEVVEAERDLISIENERLKAENIALMHKIELLEIKLAHKDELLALHNFYNKLKSNE